MIALPARESSQLAYATIAVPSRAGVAQLVEQLIRNQQVDGSSPFAGSSFPNNFIKYLNDQCFTGR